MKATKSKKKEAEEKKRGNYDEKLVITGSFMDVIKASKEHAEKNKAKKQE